MGRIINDMYLSEDEGRHLSTAEEVKTLMSLEEEIEDVERECPPHLKNSNNRQNMCDCMSVLLACKVLNIAGFSDFNTYWEKAVAVYRQAVPNAQSPLMQGLEVFESLRSLLQMPIEPVNDILPTTAFSNEQANLWTTDDIWGSENSEWLHSILSGGLPDFYTAYDDGTGSMSFSTM
ncbi:hypothetical protein EMMF5_004668 [Cystobasidiomycetes sp. EMM_F5]